MKVWVTQYSHKYGTDVHVFSSYDLAERHRQEIAAEWWDNEIGESIPRPTDPTKLADEFWERMADQGQEFFEIDEYEVIES